MNNNLSTWATEINKEWTPGYNATVTSEFLIVAFEGKELARIDYDNGRYVVSGEDKDSVEQLEHMANR